MNKRMTATGTRSSRVIEATDVVRDMVLTRLSTLIETSSALSGFHVVAMTTTGESNAIARRVSADLVVQVHTLKTKRLIAPLSAIVRADDDFFLATLVDMPVFGTGDSPESAIDELKAEVEALYQELQADDAFSDEWLNRKRLLNALVERE